MFFKPIQEYRGKSKGECNNLNFFSIGTIATFSVSEQLYLTHKSQCKTCWENSLQCSTLRTIFLNK